MALLLGCGTSEPAPPVQTEPDVPEVALDQGLFVEDQATASDLPEEDLPEPDSSEVAAPVCEPGEKRCTETAELEGCADDGQSWEMLETCAELQACDPVVGDCIDLECEPGAPICAPGGQGTTFCRSDGLGPVDIAPKPCQAGEWCFDGVEGCVAVACTPGAVGCLADGRLGICDGFEFVGQSGGCLNGECVSCPTPHAYVLCSNPGPVGPVDVKSCPPGEACVQGVGCLPEPCDAGTATCGLINSVATCQSSGQWTALECQPSDFCALLSPIAAKCEFNCSADLDCKLGSCDPLPPFGGGEDEWVVPPNPSSLDVSFGLGLTDNNKNAFVNIAPITQPYTGELLSDLVPLTLVGTQKQGNIAVFEDGEPRAIVCKPLSATTYAQLDIAFIMDVTGSMSGAINKVKTSAQELAAFLQSKGLDVRFGVVPYTDTAPSQATFPLSNDLPAFSAYVAGLLAKGGGDGPENGLDAVAAAHNTFEWRPGAQKVMLLMTDADLHQQDDGTPFAKQTLISTLELLGADFVVHTVSHGNVVLPDSKSANARQLSCVTGGTSADLQTFLTDDIKDSIFALALAKSFFCVYTTSNPFGTHDVRVDVLHDHQGQTLFGSTTKKGVNYPINP